MTTRVILVSNVAFFIEFTSFCVWKELQLLLMSYCYAETEHFLPIHREAPSFVEQSTEQEILVTGIKVLLTGHISDSSSGQIYHIVF